MFWVSGIVVLVERTCARPLAVNEWSVIGEISNYICRLWPGDISELTIGRSIDQILLSTARLQL